METVHTLKITLRHSKPGIWRRVEVPSTISLQALHKVVQGLFGWEECHLWVFETPVGDYGLSDPEFGHRSAASKKLRQVAPGVGDPFGYLYDFGDNWRHEILVEDIAAAEPGVAYPRCVGGKQAGPPEDCGGIGGYERLREILADPGHDEHEDMLSWLGLDSADEWAPARFDLLAANRALTRRVLVR